MMGLQGPEWLTPIMSVGPYPPEAPSIPRKLRFYPGNAIVLAIILVIVAMALLGVFGVSDRQVRAEAGTASVTVTYPSLIRYKMVDPLKVILAAGEQPIEDVTVVISTGFLDGFSDVTFQPAIDLVTEQDTFIGVNDLPAHETLVVSGSLQAERYWLHEGRLEVRSGDETLAGFDLATFIFP